MVHAWVRLEHGSEAAAALLCRGVGRVDSQVVCGTMVLMIGDDNNGGGNDGR